MKKKYKHELTYWLWAIVYFAFCVSSLHRAITETSSTFTPLTYIFGICFLGLGIRELFWYYDEWRKNSN